MGCGLVWMFRDSFILFDNKMFTSGVIPATVGSVT